MEGKMKLRSMTIDLTKTKKVSKERGIHCIAIHCYFFIVWFLDSSLLDALRKSKDAGIKEGQRISPN
jgi:hypothetical protein